MDQPTEADAHLTDAHLTDADLTDAELVSAVAETLGVPRLDPADSFVLHAPLELMARAALLPAVPAEFRGAARQRIADIADGWVGFGAPIGPVDPEPSAGLPQLLEAVAAGDLHAIDARAQAVIPRYTASELTGALIELVVPHLGAAGHGAIFLDLLSRHRPPTPAVPFMARSVLRELGREPDWSVRWIDGRRDDGDASGDLVEVLLAPPSPGIPESDFIHPTMSLVDRSGLAGRLLDGPTRRLPVGEARRCLLRVAAWSMLQDDPDRAPYGWSHCLTMPQAVLAVAHRTADPRRAVAVAATYVLGFRSTLAGIALDPGWIPPRPAGDPSDFIAGGASHAASIVWHDTDRRAILVRDLVGYAAAHPDAHLAKYTLACLEASHHDPEAGPLFLSAAAYLAGWWYERGWESASGLR